MLFVAPRIPDANMKRLRRSPFRHEPVDLFARYLLKERKPLTDPEAILGFVRELQASTGAALQNPQYLHGKRTESLFEMVVASLGHVQLIKQEDTGDVFYNVAGELNLPDFRMILSDGTQCLVEVKNFHQRDPFKAYSMDAQYVDSLTTYAELMRCPLYFAVYWSKWNMWTLVDAKRLSRTSNECQLRYEDAVMANAMSLVGDVLLGTRAPLAIRFEVTSEARTPDGAQRIKIQKVEVLSEDRLLTSAAEKRLATFLIFHGQWTEREQVETDEDGAITAIVFEYSPRDEANTDESQGFSFIGTLSSMLSTLYASHTFKDGQLAFLRADFEPGGAGTLLPRHTPDRCLPLWRFIQSPSKVSPD